MKTLLQKDESLSFNQQKWYRNLIEGNISIKDQIYSMTVTGNKREIVYDENNKFVGTKPFTIDYSKNLTVEQNYLQPNKGLSLIKYPGNNQMNGPGILYLPETLCTEIVLYVPKSIIKFSDEDDLSIDHDNLVDYNLIKSDKNNHSEKVNPAK